MRLRPLSLAARVLSAAFPLVIVAGCPVDSTSLQLGETAGGDSGLKAASDGREYWVEYADGTLAMFELPQYRGQEGSWQRVARSEPAWYTGPALYAVDADGAWTRLTDDSNLTLDDVIQLYDPPPAP